MNDPIDYCANELRQKNYPHYVIPLFVPEDQRAPLWAILAFDLEIARIPQVAHESTLRALRYQWWREAVERLFMGEAAAHPVLEALNAHRAGAESDFEALISAHEEEKGQHEALKALSMEAVSYRYYSKINKIFDILPNLKPGPLLPLKLWFKTLIQ